MKKRNKVLLLLAVLVTIMVSLFVYYKRPNIVNESKYKIKSVINGQNKIRGYNAKSLIVVNRENNDIFISKKENEKQRPASLAKLFVIDYALNFCKLDEEVLVKPEVLQFVKKNSSTAKLKLRKYYVKNLIAAMLVPSGNDAAYVLADYVGSKLDGRLKSSKERLNKFISSLDKYLVDKGYKNTKLYDPSGFDYNATTTVLDLKKVVDSLLKHSWFRQIVCQSVYTAVLPSGQKQIWKNTNVFLDPNSKYYKNRVIGLKTGSLNEAFNLIVLYKRYNKEFLIISLGSSTDNARYDDVLYVLKSIDQASSLKK